MNTTKSTPLILNGKEVANKICNKISKEVNELKKKGHRIPGLAVLIVGEDPASHTYVKNKEKRASEVGFYSEVHKMKASSNEEEVMSKIVELNNNEKIDGIIVQLPLPKHLNTNKILNIINPEKDADGLHPMNLGKLLTNEDGLTPCTPKGIIKLLKEYQIEISGKNAVVVGRSNLVGKPISLLLQRENATVTMAHSKTKDLQAICQSADILICAIGKPEYFDKKFIKPHTVIIDVGINRIEIDNKSKLVGDVNYQDAASITKAITPVPGGIGQMTVAMLLTNTLDAYNIRARQGEK